MNLQALETNIYARVTLIAVCLLIAAGLFIAFFEQIPIEGTTLGIDRF